ncbi:tRNA glutamyl-Q(34) synthetase GluQRS [Halochromatium glycolicum]|uniref:Glutamyl-Q tRNA(Asp) synthetase n=1 Tax=Halochromatium glycolicum TaxID=85075 RepID=A0AAJ0XCL9_9GAMM|nr:tRNA glutamyl-Q(34) synthetase GluQRS [Halochromatium glycolicum]MBK1706987.1 tRNA glutamyl-Q(34) synthetase GluQRS [Halochromatium glycolicum]
MGSSHPVTYRGRFAPSPSGPLHFGSLVAAVASYADARNQGGDWLVRIEDVDQQRTVPGADRQILSTLEAFGLHWDGPVLYQSQRSEHYEAALAQLRRAGCCYPCACTRREIAASGALGPEGPIYSGRCRSGLPAGSDPRSERLRVEPVWLQVEDRIQGSVCQNLATEVGDFVLRRADGFHAYQLAVVVDDAAQQINQVVRGADLLSSTPRQIYLQQRLGLPQPRYAHLPLALDAAGRKLSKGLASAPVDPRDPIAGLERAWCFLGQPPLPEPSTDVSHFWQQAIPRWRVDAIPRAAQRLGVGDTGKGISTRNRLSSTP